MKDVPCIPSRACGSACVSHVCTAALGITRSARQVRGGAFALQVLGRYGEYGDAILGRFGVKDDGHKIPNVRAVVKPLIGLFYGEAGGKRWRNALDQMLLKKPATVSEVIQVSVLLACCNLAVLHAVHPNPVQLWSAALPSGG